VRLEFGPEADEELQEATSWYVEHAWHVAERFVAEVERVTALIGEQPMMRPEVVPGVRRAILDGFPYSLLYAIEADRVFVLAVMHMKRHPDSWRGRRR
jgi:plasmid stabilization system protein ParE